MAGSDLPAFHGIIGRSAPMQALFRRIERVAPIDVPVLIVHGGLDKQMPPAHADRLAELARNESDSESIEVAVIKPVNHLLGPAVTGDVSEYGALTDRNVSADVSMTIASWLTRTFAAVK